jgi:hypothetical protein
MSAFRRPYRLVYAGCEPPLVIIDANDREPEAMFTSPRFGIHLTVLKAFLTAEEAVAEGERIFNSLTSSSFASGGTRFRVFLKRGGETTPLPDPAAVVDFLLTAPRDTLERLSSFNVSHPDGRSASAYLDQGAAPLLAPQNRFRMVLFIGDELVIPSGR